MPSSDRSEPSDALDGARGVDARQAGPGGEDIGHGEVDMTALAGAEPPDPPGHGGEGGGGAGGQVGGGEGGLDRPAGAAAPERARPRQVVDVVAGSVGERSVGPEARHRHVHDPGLHRSQRLVPDAQPVGDPGTEAVEDDVRGGGELSARRAVLDHLEVEHPAALPRGELPEQVGVGAHRVAAGRLDLDDIGPEVGEQAAGMGSRAPRGQLEHVAAVEGQHRPDPRRPRQDGAHGPHMVGHDRNPCERRRQDGAGANQQATFPRRPRQDGARANRRARFTRFPGHAAGRSRGAGGAGTLRPRHPGVPGGRDR